ncbi:CPBP family intramembrane metalloprotease [Rahnella sp. FRB 231]|uniref:CPBP family intramembrane metalloprotease n=2 Tax=Rahnella ecdela TaxID=2816250 RepID=A0ABS6LAF3_9GAMM|nr:CPBP family intramembrane metalloprotease [Rahnella ecdela]
MTDQICVKNIKDNLWSFLFTIAAYISFTILPYLLMRFFSVGFDDSIVVMLVGQISLAFFSYKKFSKIFSGFNFKFLASKENLTLYISLFALSLFQSSSAYIFSANNQYENSHITIPLVVVLLFIAPLYEEVFFRGLVYGLIKLKFKNETIICYFITTFLFCLIHFNSYEMHQQLNIFISGLMLCLIRERTGGLFYPVLLHSAMNFLSLVMK